MKVIFRTNAGKEGLGHLNRICSLYVAFQKNSEFNGCFITNKDAKKHLLNNNIPAEKIIVKNQYDDKDIKLFNSFRPDIIIFDTYKASKKYFTSIKHNTPSFLVLFDDYQLYSDIEIDLLINGNIYAENLDYSRIKYKSALLGPKYLVMHPKFWNLTSALPEQISSILITCGGADPRNFMIKLVDWLKDEKLKKSIVIGPYFKKKQITALKRECNETYELIMKPKGLKHYLEKSDLILTASGSTIYEVLSLKKLPILFIIAEDQELIAKEFEKLGLINLGWYNNIDQNSLKLSIKQTIDKKYSEIIEKISLIFDGQGAIRVVSEIINLYRSL